MFTSEIWSVKPTVLRTICADGTNTALEFLHTDICPETP